jgi:hypothetical protein
MGGKWRSASLGQQLRPVRVAELVREPRRRIKLLSATSHVSQAPAVLSIERILPGQESRRQSWQIGLKLRCKKATTSLFPLFGGLLGSGPIRLNGFGFHYFLQSWEVARPWRRIRGMKNPRPLSFALALIYNILVNGSILRANNF